MERELSKGELERLEEAGRLEEGGERETVEGGRDRDDLPPRVGTSLAFDVPDDLKNSKINQLPSSEEARSLDSPSKSASPRESTNQP